ncbi:cutinase [Mycobacterium sp. 1164966.3]|uniref:cutinase family protein n=1 Tax=Mycobacterium sp. 1164966.3 TaxID=1856861 RepID=UPI0007FDB859|nr:cutinase family protein [Mycobacterium sp. 1164966.3]OBA78812.1 cutinase [Mycobacterium sp. 1164966.3]
MNARDILRLVGSAILTAAGVGAAVLWTPAVPHASAQSCPDVEVVFARGTGDPPGIGKTGQAFVDSLRPRISGKSMDVYAVNYPASEQWDTGIDGIRDAGAHIVSMSNSCPQTKMVLSGFSQGAAVMGFVTSNAVPDGIDPGTVPKPMDPGVADHVAAVVLFGTPNARAMNFVGQPQVVIGPLYQPKTIKVCAVEDPVCSDGMNFSAHTTYAEDAAVIDQGAAFAASRLGGHSAPPPAGTPQPGFGE